MNGRTDFSNEYLSYNYIKLTPREKRIRFKERLKEKWGNDIFDEFESAKKNPYYPLSDLASKYGFSREYARQLFFKIYGYKYTKTLHKKRKKKKEKLVCIHNPRHKIATYKKKGPHYKSSIYETMFMDLCIEKGFDISFHKKGTVDLIVNGNNVDVKYCSKALFVKELKTPSYRYVAKGKQIFIADFFACYHPAEDDFFIIPNDFNPNKKAKSISIYINQFKSLYHNAQNKYWEYKGAYNLLV